MLNKWNKISRKPLARFVLSEANKTRKIDVFNSIIFSFFIVKYYLTKNHVKIFLSQWAPPPPPFLPFQICVEKRKGFYPVTHPHPPALCSINSYSNFWRYIHPLFSSFVEKLDVKFDP